MPEITAPDHPVHIGTTSGVSIHLGPGEKRTVPSHIAMLAAQHGCSVQQDKATAAKVTEAQVEAAVRALVEEGKPEDFTKSGEPKTAAVGARLGAEVSAAEVKRAFEKVTNSGNGANAR